MLAWWGRTGLGPKALELARAILAARGLGSLPALTDADVAKAGLLEVPGMETAFGSATAFAGIVLDSVRPVVEYGASEQAAEPYKASPVEQNLPATPGGYLSGNPSAASCDARTSLNGLSLEVSEAVQLHAVPIQTPPLHVTDLPCVVEV